MTVKRFFRISMQLQEKKWFLSSNTQPNGIETFSFLSIVTNLPMCLRRKLERIKERKLPFHWLGEERRCETRNEIAPVYFHRKNTRDTAYSLGIIRSYLLLFKRLKSYDYQKLASDVARIMYLPIAKFDSVSNTVQYRTNGTISTENGLEEN